MKKCFKCYTLLYKLEVLSKKYSYLPRIHRHPSVLIACRRNHFLGLAVCCVGSWTGRSTKQQVVIVIATGIGGERAGHDKVHVACLLRRRYEDRILDDAKAVADFLEGLLFVVA